MACVIPTKEIQKVGGRGYISFLPKTKDRDGEIPAVD